MVFNEDNKLAPPWLKYLTNQTISNRPPSPPARRRRASSSFRTGTRCWLGCCGRTSAATARPPWWPPSRPQTSITTRPSQRWGEPWIFYFNRTLTKSFVIFCCLSHEVVRDAGVNNNSIRFFLLHNKVFYYIRKRYSFISLIISPVGCLINI